MGSDAAVSVPFMHDHKMTVKSIPNYQNGTDFQPGSLLVDFVPCLQNLPRFLQPWLNLAENLRTRETKLHKRIFQTLQEQVRMGIGPECFGKTLLEVYKLPIPSHLLQLSGITCRFKKEKASVMMRHCTYSQC